ncbi:uncharacterized protein LOC141514338 isoform X2 [Macrotis lagotis]|uniref:uncharacterized protein LOC141514338 isoform X2 n=1 Tax=Macrotis lagotis TaxID=92651 RepID=UPI003D68DD51
MALPPATGYPVCICRLLPTFLAAEEVTLSFIPGHLEGSASAPEGRGLPFAPEEPSVFPRVLAVGSPGQKKYFPDIVLQGEPQLEVDQ